MNISKPETLFDTFLVESKFHCVKWCSRPSFMSCPKFMIVYRGMPCRRDCSDGQRHWFICGTHAAFLVDPHSLQKLFKKKVYLVTKIFFFVLLFMVVRYAAQQYWNEPRDIVSRWTGAVASADHTVRDNRSPGLLEHYSGRERIHESVDWVIETEFNGDIFRWGTRLARVFWWQLLLDGCQIETVLYSNDIFFFSCIWTRYACC
jgi:hypothetical protein